MMEEKRKANTFRYIIFSNYLYMFFHRLAIWIHLCTHICTIQVGFCILGCIHRYCLHIHLYLVINKGKKHFWVQRIGPWYWYLKNIGSPKVDWISNLSLFCVLIWKLPIWSNIDCYSWYFDPRKLFGTILITCWRMFVPMHFPSAERKKPSGQVHLKEPSRLTQRSLQPPFSTIHSLISGS